MTPKELTNILSEKNYRLRDRLGTFSPNLSDQELAKLRLAYMLEPGLLDSYPNARGLLELLQELQSEQELR